MKQRNNWRRRVDELTAAGYSQDQAILQAASELPLGDEKPTQGRVWTPQAPKGRQCGAERNG